MIKFTISPCIYWYNNGEGKENNVIVEKSNTLTFTEAHRAFPLHRGSAEEAVYEDNVRVKSPCVPVSFVTLFC